MYDNSSIWWYYLVQLFDNCFLILGHFLNGVNCGWSKLRLLELSGPLAAISFNSGPSLYCWSGLGSCLWGCQGLASSRSHGNGQVHSGHCRFAREAEFTFVFSHPSLPGLFFGPSLSTGHCICVIGAFRMEPVSSNWPSTMLSLFPIESGVDCWCHASLHLWPSHFLDTVSL